MREIVEIATQLTAKQTFICLYANTGSGREVRTETGDYIIGIKSKKSNDRKYKASYLH